MRIAVGNTRLFFDVDGPQLVPDGPWMRERPTVVLLHPGPGFDHLLFKIQLGPWLAERAQVVYVDQRGGGRSDAADPTELRLERWADDVRELCDALTIERPVVLGMGHGAVVALDYAARHPSHPAALVLVGPVARIVPERSLEVYERLGGSAAVEAGRRFYGEMSEQSFADFLRVCFPLLSRSQLTADVMVRAGWNPDALMGWMVGEAGAIDLRGELAAVRGARARAGRRGRRLGAARVRARGRRRPGRTDGLPELPRGAPLGLPRRPRCVRGPRALPRGPRRGR